MKKQYTIGHLNAFLLGIILTGGGFAGKRVLNKIDAIGIGLINTTERVSVLENTVNFLTDGKIIIEAKNGK